MIHFDVPFSERFGVGNPAGFWQSWGRVISSRALREQFRLSAPLGYRWAWNIFDIFNEFIYRFLPGQPGSQLKVT